MPDILFCLTAVITRIGDGKYFDNPDFLIEFSRNVFLDRHHTVENREGW